MNIREKADYLFKHGEFIGDRHELGVKKLLYSLNGKFYEISYVANENVIDYIESRSIEFVVKFYSDEVDLGEI
ncbi:hypothetical protein [Fulvivirga lutea]|uniref:Uncharacterized protein n=1 Tax=Fulvivirga lutea TaxID=2810512 RepID=A0A975A0A6_9BACT|nr:hypothetical protein [Fulvivirga lutea]QSE96611.1 hypothetical protein JR347_13535 [Fulvivirga lutea]